MDISKTGCTLRYTTVIKNGQVRYNIRLYIYLLDYIVYILDYILYIRNIIYKIILKITRENVTKISHFPSSISNQNPLPKLLKFPTVSHYFNNFTTTLITHGLHNVSFMKHWHNKILCGNFYLKIYDSIFIFRFVVKLFLLIYL